MSSNSIIQSLTWHMHRLTICLAPSLEKPSTATPGSVERLPHDIATLIVQRVFAQSIKDYGALLQTCTTIWGPWNAHFFQTMEPLPLYKTLLKCSHGDDARVSAIFRRALGLQEGYPIFFLEQELELELTDASTKAQLVGIAARFPNCSRLFIMDKRTPILPRAFFQRLATELFHVTFVEPKQQSQETAAAIAAALSELPKLEQIQLTYQQGRPIYTAST